MPCKSIKIILPIVIMIFATLWTVASCFGESLKDDIIMRADSSIFLKDAW